MRTPAAESFRFRAAMKLKIFLVLALVLSDDFIPVSFSELKFT